MIEQSRPSRPVSEAVSYSSAAPVPIVSPADLERHPLIGYIPDFIYAPELHDLGEILPGLKPILRSPSINAPYRLARSGAGVGVLLCFIGSADASLQSILPEIHITGSFWIATHPDTRNLAHIRTFVDWLVDLTSRPRIC
jgi:DNA-binding transcriptional LysR family regulator